MMEQCKEKLSIAMFGQKRIPSREGGVEIVVEELCTRMVAQGHNVTCYNRGGHHVSGSEYDSKRLKEYKGIKLKTVPTIEKKGLGHPCCLSLKVTRLIDRRIQTCKSKQLVWIGETVNITYFTKNHSAIDITDTRNGHDDRIVEFHDIRYLSFNLL